MENKTELITAIDGRSEELSKAISSRRRLLKSGGIAMGAGGALALLLGNEAHVSAQPAINAPGTSIIGLWFSTVSAADNSFPSFQAFEIYGDGIWLSSAQTDLTPAALSSTLWAVFQRVGHRTFRGMGRFWTYDSNANPTGFGAVDQTTTVGEDGNTYHGEGSLQFFDYMAIPLVRRQRSSTTARASRSFAATIMGRPAASEFNCCVQGKALIELFKSISYFGKVAVKRPNRSHA